MVGGKFWCVLGSWLVVCFAGFWILALAAVDVLGCWWFACIVGCVWSWCLADRFAGAVSCRVCGLVVCVLFGVFWIYGVVCTGFAGLLSS